MIDSRLGDIQRQIPSQPLFRLAQLQQNITQYARKIIKKTEAKTNT